MKKIILILNEKRNVFIRTQTCLSPSYNEMAGTVEFSPPVMNTKNKSVLA